MIRKVLTIALAMCAMLALLSTMAVAKGDGDEGSSDTYFGLTITCQEGEIAEKVSSDNNSKEIQITAGGTYTISGTRSQVERDWNKYAPTREVIGVTTTDKVTLILDDVTIQAPNFDMQGYQVGGIVCGENSNVHIVLQGTNTLDMSTYYNNSRSTGSAGIGLKNNAKLVISGSGSLVAKGGQNHPGIGMLTRNSNGDITINGGTIKATGGKQGAGIGCYGGSSGTVGDILIEESAGEKIHLTATGGTNSGAGIGSGLSSSYQSITIKSGVITAASDSTSYGNGAGIGGSGFSTTPPGPPTIGPITISGGTVTATGTAYGAGIGGGSQQFPAITITGGDIHAYGKYYGAGIGGGNRSEVTDGSGITITGGTIYAASGSGNGIGAGSGGKAGTVSISGTAAVTAFSRSALAIHETATVTGRSILNVQFTSAMPGSINLLEGGTTAGSLSSIPNGAKAFAYTFPSEARELRIQDGTEGREQYFAVYTDGTDSKDTYSLSADGMLTKTGLTWEKKQPTGFTITATAGANGSISPSGEVSVEAGGSKTFTITPNVGYKIADVLVDGESVGAVSIYTFSDVQANRTIAATFAYDMPTVGFEVRMNPHMGSQFEVVYTENGKILDIDLGTYVSAYIKPYIEGVTPPSRVPWTEHIYYTYTVHNVIDGEVKDDNDLYGGKKDVFGTEKIYNKNNTISKDWIVADELADERLGTSYYQIVVKAYRSNSLGQETPGSDELLGTSTMNLHVRMTKANIVLYWLDSYFWDEYFIDNDLDKIYLTAEDLIAEYLGEYISTTGYDKLEYHSLDDIPVSWELTEGTTYSTEPGAANTFTWTADPTRASNFEGWEIPEGFELSQNVTFQNPYSVTFVANGETIHTELVKKGGTLAAANFPAVPEDALGRAGVWSVTEDITNISQNITVTAVYGPDSYPITYVLNGGTNAPGNPNSYTDNDPIILTDPTRDGYIFAGWTYRDQTVPQKNLTIPAGTVTGALEFTAHWEEASQNHTITATAGAGGTITPSGTVTVAAGDSQGFTITADEGYYVQDVLVNGVSVGAVNSHTFHDVNDSHTIHAVFAQDGGEGDDNYIIEAMAGQGGTISPSGRVSVTEGGSQSFYITPDYGCHIVDVLVDGVSIGAVTSYTFDNVRADHTIYAVFDQKDYVIHATAGSGGSITPNGTVPVQAGGSQSFYITPDYGYYIVDVLVDGVSVGAVNSYTFYNVTANHTIYAVFAWGGGEITIQYVIDASAGEGGTITPHGKVYVVSGGSRTFTIAAADGYQLIDVLVDGISVGAMDTYTFTNVRKNHTIQAVFAPVDQKPGPDDTGVSQWLNTKDHMAYLHGYDDGTFGPDSRMTRAEAAQMFYNLLLDKEVPVTVSFQDVPADAWYADAVNTLASLGIITGVGDGRYEPDRAITRAEFTVIAMRFAKLPAGGQNIFSDVSAEDWYYEQVVGAVAYGWIGGYSDGTFRPKETITRAEVTAIVNRMLGRSADVTYIDSHREMLVHFADVSRFYWAYYDVAEATNAHTYRYTATGESWLET